MQLEEKQKKKPTQKKMQLEDKQEPTPAVKLLAVKAGTEAEVEATAVMAVAVATVEVEVTAVAAMVVKVAVMVAAVIHWLIMMRLPIINLQCQAVNDTLTNSALMQCRICSLMVESIVAESAFDIFEVYFPLFMYSCQ